MEENKEEKEEETNLKNKINNFHRIFDKDEDSPYLTFLYLFLLNKEVTATNLTKSLKPFKSLFKFHYKLDSRERVSLLLNKLSSEHLLEKTKKGKDVYYKSIIKQLPFLDGLETPYDFENLVRLYLEKIDLNSFLLNIKNFSSVVILSFFSKIFEEDLPLYCELMADYFIEKRSIKQRLMREGKAHDNKSIEKYEEWLCSEDYWEKAVRATAKIKDCVGTVIPQVKTIRKILIPFMKRNDFLIPSIKNQTYDDMQKIIKLLKIRNFDRKSIHSDFERFEKVECSIIYDEIRKCIDIVLKKQYFK